jgi:hypothetical protein
MQGRILFTDYIKAFYKAWFLFLMAVSEYYYFLGCNIMLFDTYLLNYTGSEAQNSNLHFIEYFKANYETW